MASTASPAFVAGDSQQASEARSGSPPIEPHRARLGQLANPDGGWSYLPGRASRIEPTAWAALALGVTTPAGRRAVDRLATWRRQGPWLADVEGAPINFGFNAIAGLALDAARRDEARPLAAALLDVRGARFDQSPAIRQDNSLQAWPWMDGTFSWVEPTAWSLLLVKKLKTTLPVAAAMERIAIAEAVLRDRACGAGGWNYGGSNVYGQELFPYVPTTAIGILAMQDHLNDPIVRRAIDWLAAQALSEATLVSLGLAMVALRIAGRRATEIERRLSGALDSARARTGESIHGQAVAIYALRGEDGYAAFGL